MTYDLTYKAHIMHDTYNVHVHIHTYNTALPGTPRRDFRRVQWVLHLLPVTMVTMVTMVTNGYHGNTKILEHTTDSLTARGMRISTTP